MSTVFSRPSQAYGTGVRQFPVSGLPAGQLQITLNLTRESWPAGVVAVLTIKYSNGLGITSSVTGDSLLDKAGAERTSLSIGINKPAGITAGTITVDVQQAVTTTITADAS